MSLLWYASYLQIIKCPSSCWNFDIFSFWKIIDKLYKLSRGLFLSQITPTADCRRVLTDATIFMLALWHFAFLLLACISLRIS